MVHDVSPLTWVYLCENSLGYFVNRSMNILDPSEGLWLYKLNISNLRWKELVLFYFYANDSNGYVGINNNLGSEFLIEREDFEVPISEIFYIPYVNNTVVTRSTLFTILSNDNFGSGISSIKYKIEY